MLSLRTTVPNPSSRVCAQQRYELSDYFSSYETARSGGLSSFERPDHRSHAPGLRGFKPCLIESPELVGSVGVNLGFDEPSARYIGSSRF